MKKLIRDYSSHAALTPHIIVRLHATAEGDGLVEERLHALEALEVPLHLRLTPPHLTHAVVQTVDHHHAEEELGLDAMAPFSGTVFDLAENVCIYEAQGIKITKAAVSPKTSKAARAFQKLVAMGQRLMSVIRKSEGIPNKDLDRFTREVQSLCDKWDRDDLS